MYKLYKEYIFWLDMSENALGFEILIQCWCPEKKKYIISR